MNIRLLAIRLSLSVLLLIPTACFAQTNCQSGNGDLNSELPTKLDSEEIIRRFAANESAFKKARNTYTYVQDVTVQTLAGMTPNGKPIVDGEFRQVMDVSYDDHGKRIEHVTYAPQSSLRRINVGPSDLEDIREFMGFPITSETLSQYKISYRGQQRVDQLDTYVFEVAPKTLDRGKRYFSGTFWVESRDLAVVKTCGKSVPDAAPSGTRNRGAQDVTPQFVTYREQFGPNWFPTYARSDDFLWFSNGHVRIREIVKYSNYRLTSPPDVPAKALSPKPQP